MVINIKRFLSQKFVKNDDLSSEEEPSIYKDQNKKEEQTNESSECYYWIGKDYANTFKVDFKECADFEKGIFKF